MIWPERDATVELVMEVLRLLPSVELKRLKIGWRVAQEIKAGRVGPHRLAAWTGLGFRPKSRST